MKLCVQNIDFSYRKLKLFENFSVTFHPGINMLIGSNGSGKTTLMKMLAEVYHPKGGVICLDDKKYSDYQDIRQHISYLPQEFTAYQEMKVKDFLNFIAEIKFQKKAKYLQDRISDAIEKTDISEFLDKRIKELSGGMKKRVGIAQAIVSDAQIIIADEPTAALDPEQCEMFNGLLKQLAKDRIIVISTHIIQDIYEECENIFILSEGVLKYNGSFKQLQDTLANRVFKMDKKDFNKMDQTKIKAIGNFEENGKEYIKFCALPDEGIRTEWQSCSYTSADIWRYFK